LASLVEKQLWGTKVVSPHGTVPKPLQQLQAFQYQNDTINANKNMTDCRELLAYPWSAIVLKAPCANFLALQLISVFKTQVQQARPAQATRPGSLIFDFESSWREKTQ